MKLGYVEAVTKAVESGVSDDMFRVWMFGSIGWCHTPNYAAVENMHQSIDYRDDLVMSLLVENESYKFCKRRGYE